MERATCHAAVFVIGPIVFPCIYAEFTNSVKPCLWCCCVYCYIELFLVCYYIFHLNLTFFIVVSSSSSHSSPHSLHKMWLIVFSAQFDTSAEQSLLLWQYGHISGWFLYAVSSSFLVFIFQVFIVSKHILYVCFIHVFDTSKQYFPRSPFSVVYLLEKKLCIFSSCHCWYSFLLRDPVFCLFLSIDILLQDFCQTILGRSLS